MDEFPHAKVILSVRSNEDQWFASFHRHNETVRTARNEVLPDFYIPLFELSARILPGLFLPILEGLSFTEQQRTFGYGSPRPGSFLAKKVYREHNESVLRHVPPEKLLVHKPEDGWAPLAAFLSIPCPDQLYPQANKSEDLGPMLVKKFRGPLRVLKLLSLIIPLVLFIILMIIMWLILRNIH